MHIQSLQLTQIQSMLKLVRNIVFLVFLSFVLASCGGNKVVATVDDSADYKSARELPPLKKPVRQVASEQASSQQATVTEQDENQNLTDEPAPAAIPSVTSPPADRPIAASVVAVQGRSRLMIEASADEAWSFLMRSIAKSDITVFSRNQAIGRIEIGCSDIESKADSGTEPVKKNGWVLFDRAKETKQDYCALDTVSDKQGMQVRVMNRSGLEASSASAEKIFERILNN